MTIRNLVKSELAKRGYPVEISESHKRKTHVSNLYSKTVSQQGIELQRNISNKYQSWLGKDDKVESLIVYTNNYISIEEMNEIISQCKSNYKPYHTEVITVVY